jgi:hypothetical protein
MDAYHLGRRQSTRPAATGTLVFMSSSNGPFGFDPEDFERVVREAGEGLREALGRAGWSTLFDEFSRGARPRTQPETTGEAGDGVWAIYTTDATGGAHIEQVYPTELDALRANKDNVDPKRRVRFLPYGIAVSVLDAAAGGGESESPAGGGETNSAAGGGETNPADGDDSGSADQHP